jgi:hypothetical protein
MDDGGGAHAVGRLELRYCGAVEQGDAVEVFTGLDDVGSDPPRRRTAGDDSDSGDRRNVESDARCRRKVVEAIVSVQHLGGGFVTLGNGIEGVIDADDDGNPAGRNGANRRREGNSRE